MRIGAAIVFIVTTSALVACGDSQSFSQIEATESDADGLIEYAMPEGWTNTRISSGNHFSRADEIDDSAILGVVPRKRGSAPSVDEVRIGTTSKHEFQGHKLITEETSNMNGFFVWEAVYEAEIRGRDVILHDYFLFSEELQVEVHLNAARERYEEFLPDLRTVVGSIRARSAGDDRR